MTYQEEHDARQRRLAAEDRETNWPLWLVGGMALMLLVAFLAWGTGTPTNTASNPAPVTESRSTTGSGTTSPVPNNPKSTAPADSQPNRGDAGSSPTRAPASR